MRDASFRAGLHSPDRMVSLCRFCPNSATGLHGPNLYLTIYSRPYIAILGRRETGEFGDSSRHADASPIAGLVIMRMDAPLYFFNANVARTQILSQVASAHPRAVLLDLGASADLDIGTSDMLKDLIENLRGNDVDVLLAQVRGSVRKRMSLTGLSDHIGEDHVFLSVVAAVRWFETSALAPNTTGTETGDSDSAGLDPLVA